MKPAQKVSDDEVIARAQRALLRASDKAMADYKQFGIEPVLAPPIQSPPKKNPGGPQK